MSDLGRRRRKYLREGWTGDADLPARQSMCAAPLISPQPRASSPARSRRRWRAPTVRWICWITGVSSLGATNRWSQNSPGALPLVPVKPMVTRPCARAVRSAASMFGERARGGKRQQHVAALAEARDLAREHLFEAVIVGDRRQCRGVGGQRDRGVAGTVLLVAADDLGGDMLGVGGAAAIADDQELVAGAQRRDDERRSGARWRAAPRPAPLAASACER